MDHPTTTATPSTPPPDPEAEVLAYVRNRSVPCPRCGYDLRDIQTARCPECGEPLVLKIGSPRATFGWLILAMAPGCFSGVAALFVLVPIVMTLGARYPAGSNEGLPWPVAIADGFGFLSAASVWIMYRHRQQFMSWTSYRQRIVAGTVWAIHVAAFGLFLLTMWLVTK